MDDKTTRDTIAGTNEAVDILRDHAKTAKAHLDKSRGAIADSQALLRGVDPPPPPPGADGDPEAATDPAPVPKPGAAGGGPRPK